MSSTIDGIIDGLLRGDPRAADTFYQQYGSALRRLADAHLPRGLRRRFDADDVVQSACRTFFRRAGEGRFRLEGTQSVWSLLCAITLTKVREQARFHLRGKRGVGREVAAEFSSSSDGSAGPSPADPTPAPDEALAFADQFQHLLDSFNEEERQIIDLKLQDLTHLQVAERIGSSERTVRRILKDLQTRLERQLSADK
jgi:RNA polymerase sigma factor (sigma-70 family)